MSKTEGVKTEVVKIAERVKIAEGVKTAEGVNLEFLQLKS